MEMGKSVDAAATAREPRAQGCDGSAMVYLMYLMYM